MNLSFWNRANWLAHLSGTNLHICSFAKKKKKQSPELVSVHLITSKLKTQLNVMCALCLTLPNSLQQRSFEKELQSQKSRIMALRNTYVLGMNLWHSHFSKGSQGLTQNRRLIKRRTVEALMLKSRVTLEFSSRKGHLTSISFPLTICAFLDKHWYPSFKSCVSDRIKVNLHSSQWWFF